jgi:hypothetical protein
MITAIDPKEFLLDQINKKIKEIDRALEFYETLLDSMPEEETWKIKQIFENKGDTITPGENVSPVDFLGETRELCGFR